MSNVLYIDPEKCTGCRVCEMVCSVKHADVVNPLRSRIKVRKAEWQGKYTPATCRQCESPRCMAACPNGAISRDPELNSVVVDYEKCENCRSCVAACPFGAMTVDPVDDIVIKCDLCGGEPECVRFCETEAILYLDPAEPKPDAKQVVV